MPQPTIGLEILTALGIDVDRCRWADIHFAPGQPATLIAEMYLPDDTGTILEHYHLVPKAEEKE